MGKVPAALKKLAANAKSQAVIPMYAAPPAPKQPKAKEEKGKKGDAGGSKATVPAGEPGSFDAIHSATATQELQWHLLAYRLTPGTTLSRTMTGSSAADVAKPIPKGKETKSPS